MATTGLPEKEGIRSMDTQYLFCDVNPPNEPAFPIKDLYG